MNGRPLLIRNDQPISDISVVINLVYGGPNWLLVQNGLDDKTKARSKSGDDRVALDFEDDRVSSSGRLRSGTDRFSSFAIRRICSGLLPYTSSFSHHPTLLCCFTLYLLHVRPVQTALIALVSRLQVELTVRTANRTHAPERICSAKSGARESISCVQHLHGEVAAEMLFYFQYKLRPVLSRFPSPTSDRFVHTARGQRPSDTFPSPAHASYYISSPT
jgi:hypothetical protein